MYKSLNKSIWTYGLQLWGNAKKSNLNRIQAFQNIALRKLTISPPICFKSYPSHRPENQNCKKKAVTYYKRFHNWLATHSNLLIKSLSSHGIPGNPQRHLKRNWCRDMLTYLYIYINILYYIYICKN